MSAVLADYRANFRDLAATISATPSPQDMRSYIDGLRAIDTHDKNYFGQYSMAATIVRDLRVQALEPRYKELRAQWQEHVDQIANAVSMIVPEELNPGMGPTLMSILRALEEGLDDGFRDDAFGDLKEEALRITEAAIASCRQALAEVALMVVDPDRFKPDPNAPIEALEFALEQSKKLPLTMEAFMGDEAKLAEAKRRFPLWIKKQEELLAKRHAEEEQRLAASVEVGIESRDEKEHRNRINDAGLTAEQRGARQARMHEAAQPMYELIRRVTEIAHLDDAECVGVIDGNGLLEVAHRCEALVARIEGRTN